MANDCLPGELLARAAAGELTPVEREQTADHLATCSACAGEYRAISSLKSWAEDMSADASVAPPVTAAPIRLLPSTYNPQLETAGGKSRSSFYFPYALAAAAVILSLTLGALLISKSRENQRLLAQADEAARRNAEAIPTAEPLAESRRLLDETTRRAEEESAARRAAEAELARRDAAARPSNQPRGKVASGQRRDEARFSAPDVNVPIFDLDPQDGGRGEQSSQITTIELSPDTDLFTLILNLGGKQASGSFSLEVIDKNNRTVWTGRGLRKSAYNNFTVAMRRRSFPEGEYRLKLFGSSDGRRQLIEQYTIRLAYR
jgi:hypothetical protein